MDTSFLPPSGFTGTFTTGLVLLRPFGQMLREKPCTGRDSPIAVGAHVPLHSGADWWPQSAAPPSWRAAMQRAAAAAAAAQQRCALVAIARIGACIERGTREAAASPLKKWHLQQFRYHWIFDKIYYLSSPLMTLSYQPNTVCGQRFTVHSKLSRAIERDFAQQRVAARSHALVRARAR